VTLLASPALTWLRAAGGALAVDAVRRWVVGRVPCSWPWLPCVALSDFVREAARLFVVVGFACSFPRGVSDASFMKKTPFYRLARHRWRRNLSSQP